MLGLCFCLPPSQASWLEATVSPCLRSYITSDEHRKPLHSSVVPHTSESRSLQISMALSFKAFFSVKLWSMVPSAFLFPQSSRFFEHLQSDFPKHWTGPQVTMTCSLPSHVSPLVSILLSLPEIHTHAGLTFRSLSRNRLLHGEEAWRRRKASLEKCPPGESAAWLGWEASTKLPKPKSFVPTLSLWAMSS